MSIDFPVRFKRLVGDLIVLCEAERSVSGTSEKAMCAGRARSSCSLSVCKEVIQANAVHLETVERDGGQRRSCWVLPVALTTRRQSRQKRSIPAEPHRFFLGRVDLGPAHSHVMQIQHHDRRAHGTGHAVGVIARGWSRRRTSQCNSEHRTGHM